MSNALTKLRTLTAITVVISAQAMFAQTQELPYEIDFNTEANVKTWKLLDQNNDGDNWGARCWSWWSNNRILRYNLVSSQKGSSDDWAISPAFTLEAGTQYEMSYYFYGYTSSSKNLPVEIRLVTSNTAPEATGTLLASYPAKEGEGTTDKNGESKTVSFTVSASGVYYIGAYMSASYDSSKYGNIVFRNFGLKALQKATAPGALTDVTAAADASGANTIDINYTLPSVDAEGNPLDGQVRINVYAEDEETIKASTPYGEPGSTGTLKLTDCYTGETWIRLKAENKAGEGTEKRIDLYVGEDVPVAVSELKAEIAEDGKITVSWTAPTQSLHGCYVNYDNLTYHVNRVLDDQLTSVGSVSGTSFTDNDLSGDRQANVSYQVVGQSSAGFGASAQTKILNYGPALALPFAESFSEKSFHTSPWRQEVVKNFEDANYQPSWDLTDQAKVVDNVTDDNPDGEEVIIASQDTDRGFIRFNSNAVGKAKDPASGRLVLPAINFSDMLNPVLTFWMFRETYYTTNPATNGGYRDDFVRVEVSADNGDFAPVEGAEFHRYGKQNNWVLCEVPLYAVSGKERVQVAINGYGHGGGPIYIDNIRIEERTAHDLQAVALSGPKRVRVGETADFVLTLKNGGGREASGYSVELCKDGLKVLSAEGSALAPGKSKSMTLTFEPEAGEEGMTCDFTAKVIYSADQDMENNLSEAVTTMITAPLRPAVTGLNASVSDDKVHLTWNKANWLPAETLVEEDSFEGYEPFVFNTFGDFRCFDLDNRITFGIGASAGVTYPNSGEKMAFQIFCPTETNIPEEELGMWAVHSGANMAIAPQAQSNGEPVASNDWLIFPSLSGNAQTIRFFARSLNDNYGEFIQGFYATTSNPTEAEDFLPCPDGGDISYSVPVEWKELSYSVPQGARYFALRHTSADGYALMVDDVCYQRSIPDANEAGILGYNVYCNGEKINETPVTERALDHAPGAEGQIEYHVTAVYPDGESSKCDPVKVNFTMSGMDGSIDESFMISTEGVRITISGAAGAEIALFTTSGIMLSHAVSDGNCAIDAPSQGIYILTVGSRSYKINIR